MARTGISIKVSNAVFGSVVNVDANSMLVVAGAAALSSGDLAFALDIPYLLRSFEDLETLGIDEANNSAIYKQVKGFYAPKSGVNNTGVVLWLVGVATLTSADVIISATRATVANGFEFRPRNILISQLNVFAARPLEPSAIQAAIDALYIEGFGTVAILGDIIRGDVNSATLEDLQTQDAPMVGMLVVSDIASSIAAVGKVGGFMASLSVGTSIGDASLSAFAADMYFVDQSAEGVYVNTHCSGLALAKFNALGDNQYIFARTRPPYNGLWLNDGATCVDKTTALSTLESTRTIASIVDELRTFLTPYLNNKIPVNKDGDIQSTYKQVVLENARIKVIMPYIQSGDISDANITISAKDDDMVGTRTWEVALSVLPAPTLRWIDGYVFYVKSL